MVSDLELPRSAPEWAALCLQAVDPGDKTTLCLAAEAAMKAGRLLPLPDAPWAQPPPPGRPARPLLVAPQQVPRRRLGSAPGRAALVHAVAHIEFNAMNLAADAVCRFPGLPAAFYRDWLGIAADEARHFRLLAGRLEELGHVYGDFEAHDGLWEMAARTADDPLARMALVPRLLEARGLDVTPPMIQRLRRVGDSATVVILERILREEVPHVAAGSRWFRYLCDGRGVEPQATFRALLRSHARLPLKGPLNLRDRQCAGFSLRELEALQAAD